jgi:chloramphenicol 3-O phosphotransferase
MNDPSMPGQIVILNGPPRAGKSSIASAIQDSFDGVWMNLGHDVFISATPAQLRPGVGLRPGPGPERGGERADVVEVLPALFAGWFDSIAAHSRHGLNVVVDAGLHRAVDARLLSHAARRLEGLPVLFVGVHCPIEEIMRRRAESEPGRYARATADTPIPPPAALWQLAVHEHRYDLEVDTSELSPGECAEQIRGRLEAGPPGSAFAELALG